VVLIKKTMRTIDKLNMSPEIVKGDGLVTKADLRATIMALLQIIGVEEIVENTILSGTTMSTCQAFLSTGLNVVTSASESSNAIKLPNPPKKGTSSTIINNSGFPIVVYPSVEGGSINGTINGSAIIPSDGKPYVFYCWENPLPGAWTWTPPATNQYDSGDITVLTPGGSNVISMVNSSFFNIGTQLISAGGGVLSPNIMKDIPVTGGFLSMFKPATMWNSITKVKVYTNILTLNNLISVGINSGGSYSTINTTTGIENAWSVVEPITQPYFSVSNNATWQTVPGTPSIGAFSANIGDPGTKFIEANCSYFAPHVSFNLFDQIQPYGASSNFGSSFIGNELDPYDGTIYEKWFTQYFWLYIIPRGTAGGNLKVRFFIEYN